MEWLEAGCVILVQLPGPTWKMWWITPTVPTISVLAKFIPSAAPVIYKALCWWYNTLQTCPYSVLIFSHPFNRLRLSWLPFCLCFDVSRSINHQSLFVSIQYKYARDRDFMLLSTMYVFTSRSMWQWPLNIETVQMHSGSIKKLTNYHVWFFGFSFLYRTKKNNQYQTSIGHYDSQMISNHYLGKKNVIRKIDYTFIYVQTVINDINNISAPTYQHTPTQRFSSSIQGSFRRNPTIETLLTWMFLTWNYRVQVSLQTFSLHNGLFVKGLFAPAFRAFLVRENSRYIKCCVVHLDVWPFCQHLNTINYKNNYTLKTRNIWRQYCQHWQ